MHYFQHCALTATGKQLPKWGFEQQEVSCNPNLRDKNALWNVEDNYFENCEYFYLFYILFASKKFHFAQNFYISFEKFVHSKLLHKIFFIRSLQKFSFLQDLLFLPSFLFSEENLLNWCICNNKNAILRYFCKVKLNDGNIEKINAIDRKIL